jgi:GNAT superfamily N-acetyltransferase
MKFDVTVGTTPSRTVRAQQLAAAFDVPFRERDELTWAGELPIEERDWNVGLIVGPSGSGKTTILRETFGEPLAYTWRGDAVVDDFPADLGMEDVTAACSAVGFNTIPAWLRPFDVLSNGEQFRVTLARALAESSDAAPVVMDEFTSVVDRQVAKIGAHAVQKWCRKHGRRFVAATCHYDVLEWLQPDWVFEPASLTFEWRHLQPRPALPCVIERVPYAAWARFAPFHYLTSELHKAAICFVLYAGEAEQPAAFAGVLHRPHPVAKDIKGVSRLVTLPDWQGLGLAFALVDRLGAAYNALGFELHTYPAHPALIRSFDRSPMWELRHRPGTYVNFRRTRGMQKTKRMPKAQGARPNAVFRFRGEPLEAGVAQSFVDPSGTSASLKRMRTTSSMPG